MSKYFSFAREICGTVAPWLEPMRYLTAMLMQAIASKIARQASTLLSFIPFTECCSCAIIHCGKQPPWCVHVEGDQRGADTGGPLCY
jgi:hypothetical protein